MVAWGSADSYQKVRKLFLVIGRPSLIRVLAQTVQVASWHLHGPLSKDTGTT